MDEEILFGRIRDLEVHTAVHKEKLDGIDKRLDKLEFKVAGWVGLLVLLIQAGFQIWGRH